MERNEFYRRRAATIGAETSALLVEILEKYEALVNLEAQRNLKPNPGKAAAEYGAWRERYRKLSLTLAVEGCEELARRIARETSDSLWAGFEQSAEPVSDDRKPVPEGQPQE